MTRRWRASVRSLASMAAVALLVPACQDGPTAGALDSSLPQLRLTTVSGDSQTGEAGRLLERFLVFRVTDTAGRPVAGLRVEWEVVAGGGRVSGKRHDTDLAGLAAGNFTLGATPGENVARAIVRDSLSIKFTAFARAPALEGPLP